MHNLNCISLLLRALVFLICSYFFAFLDFAVGVFFTAVFVISLIIFNYVIKSKNKFLYIIDMFFVLFLVIHGIGVIRGWYDSAYYFDSLLHFVSGLFIGLLATVFFKLRSGSFFKRELSLIITALVVSICFAVFWEIFEFLWDIIIAPVSNLPFAQKGIFDTLGDIGWNALGSMIGVVLYYLFGRNVKNNKNPKSRKNKPDFQSRNKK